MFINIIIKSVNYQIFTINGAIFYNFSIKNILDNNQNNFKLTQNLHLGEHSSIIEMLVCKF